MRRLFILFVFHNLLGKEAHSHAASFNMGYLSISPYSYANGAAGIPVSMVSQLSLYVHKNTIQPHQLILLTMK